MALPRRTRIALAIGGAVLAVPAIALAAALLMLRNADWDRARPWLNDTASAAMGRPVEIRGKLALTWERRSASAGGQGWRARLPWPRVVAREVHLGNPAGMAPGDMASVAALAFSLDPLALLRKEISIPELRVDTPAVLLQRDADGSNNWTFKKKASSWQLDLQRIVFSKGSVRYRDAVAHADASAEISAIDAGPEQGGGYGVAWTLRGTWRGAPVAGSGKAGAALSLQRQDTPFPLQADVDLGGTRIAAEGTLSGPDALDLQLTLSAPSMARLYALTGILLPETPPFSTSGRLSATLGKDGAGAEDSRFIYDRFTGRVGSSDIAGHLEYRRKKPRGYLSGDVASRLLQFADLGPAIGADSSASKAARGAPLRQPGGKVLPVEAFQTGRWTSIDADVKFRADRLVRRKQLPMSNLATTIHMKEGVLSLAPLNFDWAGGKLTSVVRFDGSGKAVKDAIRADLQASARHLKLNQLFPTLKGLQAGTGDINADARLSATGNSVASLLGASNGEVTASIRQGSISKLLLEQMGLNVGNVLLTTLSGDRQVKLHCMAADLAVTNGLAQTRQFLVDTEDATIQVSGNVDLASEQLDLTLRPDSKGLRIFTLRAPLYVTGTFKQPAVSVDKGVLVAKAGGAVALAAAAPVAALIPLISTGPGQDGRCAALLARARAKPVAPPSGRTPQGAPARSTGGAG